MYCLKKFIEMKKFFFLVGLCTVLCGQPVLADSQPWCLVTDNGSAVPVSSVACLATTAEDGETFAVVMTDGTILGGVSKATFEQRVPTAIEAVESNPIRVTDELSLDGIDPATPVSVYTTGGKLLRKTSAKQIQLSDLPSGIYIIKVNETSFKIAKQ